MSAGWNCNLWTPLEKQKSPSSDGLFNTQKVITQVIRGNSARPLTGICSALKTSMIWKQFIKYEDCEKLSLSADDLKVSRWRLHENDPA